MSSSSSYAPDGSDQYSESDEDNIPSGKENKGFPTLHSPARDLELSSSPDLTGPNDDDATVKSHLPKSQTALSRLRAIRRSGLTPNAIEAYLELLRDQKENTALLPTIEDSCADKQIGIVIWTPKERNVFFNMLATKSLNGISDIARAIGSKSELEVQDYIQQIRQSIEWRHLHVRRPPQTTYADIPTAVEISNDCGFALDHLAEYILLREQVNDETSARRIHGDLWAVNAERADEVESQISISNDQTVISNTHSSIYLSASLLRINMWIRLSERLFMNFGRNRIEDNWANIAFQNETPTITADAFAEFYTLLVSLTRRLVQSTIFFAESRIRNLPDQNAAKVKTRDVRAALDVLNMKHDSHDFWVGLARRCSLDIADIRHLKGWKSNYLDYDEVEDILSGEDPLISAHIRSASSEQAVAVHSESSEDYEDNGSIGDFDEDEPFDEEQDSNSDGTPNLGKRKANDYDHYHNHEDQRAELFDRQSQYSEELRLCHLLHCPLFARVPPLVKLEAQHDREIEAVNSERIPPNNRSLFARKSKEDLVNWRDITLHRSEWEEFGPRYRQIEEHFNLGRRKRLRISAKSSTKAAWVDNELIASENGDDGEFLTNLNQKSNPERDDVSSEDSTSIYSD